MFSYKADELFCENVPVERIISSAGSPVYIYSKKQIADNYLSFDAAFGSVPHLVCYAVKANTNYRICRTVFSLGSGADVASGGELYRSLQAGAHPSKIVFAGVGKTDGEIEFAARKNVLMFNAESAEELENINRIGGRLKKKLKAAIRINPGIDPHTHKFITTGKSRTKFGIPVKEALGIYARRSRYKNLDLCGIHCHIGSQLTSTGPFVLMAKKLEHIVKGLQKNGISLKYVNVGGGLGIRYHKENPPTPARLAEAMLPSLRKLGVVLIFEPGRYIIGNTGIMAARVLYRKVSNGKKFLIVDAGMSDLIRPSFYGAYHGIIPVSAGKANTRGIDVVGPICESSDFLGKDRALPWLEKGECLAVKCAGAYCFSMSSQYNSRLRAAEVLVDGSKWELIRSRETYEDLVNREIK